MYIMCIFAQPKKILMTNLKRFILSAAFALCSLAVCAQPAQNFINNVLKRDPLFKNAVVGICAVDNNGKKVASWNSNFPLLTASTMKTITTGTVLSILGPDFRYETSISINGPVKDNVLYGNLTIIGGGDPTLGSKDTVAYSIDSLFGVWTDALKSKGITKIIGNIVADDSYFVREAIPDNWDWGNLGWDYGCAASGLSFMENTQIIRTMPGCKEGDGISIEVVYPQLPGQKILNEAVTGAAQTGDNVYYYPSDMLKTSRIEGSLAVDHKPVDNTWANKFPHLSVAAEYLRYLQTNGIEVIAPGSVNGNSTSAEAVVKDIKEMPADYAKGADTISTVYSPKLINIINVTNRISNNFYAETFLKTVGKKLADKSSISASTRILREYLEEQGVDLLGFRQADGSGLSRMNFVSAEFFTRFYAFMQKSSNFKEYLASFPYPGGPGTLKSVLKENKYAKEKWRIHAKSGSLTGVRCYAGYVESKSNGLVRFAILVNNYSVPTSKMQPNIEKFLWELTK